ncbi:hypothetical protein GMRT_10543 [Giardia muris]|uniref:Coiled-coil protein n=1 Tax=Giardia muris TaxID=5742 RepID=A0A4Z1T1P4_GIAMU|nr:hypothetical protein GMRT_10543 [Giardia muris]|eukprot:TNJ26877.1 hypothetical protein GMRT_10543 [Giardia muris]
MPADQGKETDPREEGATLELVYPHVQDVCLSSLVDVSISPRTQRVVIRGHAIRNIDVLTNYRTITCLELGSIQLDMSFSAFLHLVGARDSFPSLRSVSIDSVLFQKPSQRAVTKKRRNNLEVLMVKGLFLADGTPFGTFLEYASTALNSITLKELVLSFQERGLTLSQLASTGSGLRLDEVPEDTQVVKLLVYFPNLQRYNGSDITPELRNLSQAHAKRLVISMRNRLQEASTLITDSSTSLTKQSALLQKKEEDLETERARNAELLERSLVLEARCTSLNEALQRAQSHTELVGYLQGLARPVNLEETYPHDLSTRITSCLSRITGSSSHSGPSERLLEATLMLQEQGTTPSVSTLVAYLEAQCNRSGMLSEDMQAQFFQRSQKQYAEIQTLIDALLEAREQLELNRREADDLLTRSQNSETQNAELRRRVKDLEERLRVSPPMQLQAGPPSAKEKKAYEQQIEELTGQVEVLRDQLELQKLEATVSPDYVCSRCLDASLNRLQDTLSTSKGSARSRHRTPRELRSASDASDQEVKRPLSSVMIQTTGTETYATREAEIQTFQMLQVLQSAQGTQTTGDDTSSSDPDVAVTLARLEGQYDRLSTAYNVFQEQFAASTMEAERLRKENTQLRRDCEALADELRGRASSPTRDRSEKAKLLLEISRLTEQRDSYKEKLRKAVAYARQVMAAYETLSTAITTAKAKSPRRRASSGDGYIKQLNALENDVERLRHLNEVQRRKVEACSRRKPQSPRAREPNTLLSQDFVRELEKLATHIDAVLGV